MTKSVTILTGEPTISVLAEMQLNTLGIEEMMEWVRERSPECLPGEDVLKPGQEWLALFPHGGIDEENGRMLTSNELLVELAGRKCYNSFGLKAGKKSNREYIAHTQHGAVPHASILYHAKMTFFIAGISRRVSQELMRNYVGADRNEEGSPSQESSRFTHHDGVFVAHPYLLDKPKELELWKASVQRSYDDYIAYIERRWADFEQEHGYKPMGMDRKRVYESSIGRMPWEFGTSFVWTTNPMALKKLFKERCDEAADLEFQRFAGKWRRICQDRWPSLFPATTAV